MAEENQQQGETTPAPGQAAGDTPAGAENTGTMIPKARFDEVNRRAKEAEKTAADLMARIEALEQARLSETGNYQELAKREATRAKELEPYKMRAEVLETMIREGNEKRISAIPERMRSLVEPLRASLAPEALAAYLDANWSMLTARQAPDMNAGQSGGGQAVQVTDADRIAAAAASASGHKITPEQIAARRLKK